MYSFPQQPRSIWELTKDSFRFFATAFFRVLLLVAIMTIFTIGSNPRTYQLTYLHGHALWWGLLILSSLLNGYFVCAIFQKMYGIVNQKPENIFSIFIHVFPKFIKYTIAFIIYILLFALIVIVLSLIATICVMVPLLLIKLIFSLPAVSVFHVGTGIVITLFAILVVLFAVFASVILRFYIPLILFDNAGPINVLKKSLKLVWGGWWRTFAVLLVAFLLAMIVVVPAIMIFYYLHVSHSVWIVFQAIVSLLFVPWGAAVILNLYNDLRIRKQYS